MLGKIYFMLCMQNTLPGQSAGNFSFSVKTSVNTKSTYNSYRQLPLISVHVANHKSDLNDEEFGYFLAGLIEGDG